MFRIKRIRTLTWLAIKLRSTYFCLSHGNLFNFFLLLTTNNLSSPVLCLRTWSRLCTARASLREPQRTGTSLGPWHRPLTWPPRETSFFRPSAAPQTKLFYRREWNTSFIWDVFWEKSPDRKNILWLNFIANYETHIKLILLNNLILQISNPFIQIDNPLIWKFVITLEYQV